MKLSQMERAEGLIHARVKLCWRIIEFDDMGRRTAWANGPRPRLTACQHVSFG